MTAPEGAPFKKETGLRHFIAAAGYSWQGFLRLIRESAFRHELVAFIAGLILLLLLGVGLLKLTIFVILMLALFATEAINTAIEELVDRVSPEYSQVGKHAKDLGSFAVLCFILINGLYLAAVIADLIWPGLF